MYRHQKDVTDTLNALIEEYAASVESSRGYGKMVRPANGRRQGDSVGESQRITPRVSTM